MRKSIYTKEHRLIVHNLRVLRNKAGMTQTQVAKKLGKPQSFVARMESGQRRIDLVELGIVAEIYNCKVTDFLTETADKKETLDKILDFKKNYRK